MQTTHKSCGLMLKPCSATLGQLTRSNRTKLGLNISEGDYGNVVYNLLQRPYSNKHEN